jgi:diguanylate cyclase (GGDEF)-like protein/PAS domain S-box-containing protein
MSDSEQLDLEKFFNHAMDMCCIAGVDGYFKRVNPAFERVLGYTREELMASPFVEFVHPDDLPNTAAEIGKLADGAPTLSFENRYRCKDGSYKDLHWTSFPDPESGLLYAIARDVTNQRLREDRIDRLTGVATRRVFEQLIDEEWRRSYRSKAPLAVALIDVDHFKAFNASNGHQTGDQRLRELAQLFSDHVRRTGDLVSRYDGQEFALILAGGLTAEKAVELCERIRDGVEQLGIAHPEAKPAGLLTVSIGTATVVPNRESAPSLLVGAADTALRKAKNQGRNRVVSSQS